jgi:hypothetical protein
MVGTLPSIALCEKASPDLFSKDSQGNIDWGKTLARVPEPAFWDDVAKVAGVKVRLTPSLERQRSSLESPDV